MKYNVTISQEEIEQDIANGLTLKQTVAMAKAESKKGNDAYITWFRASDGQHGYYNEGEGHAVIGKAW